MGGQQSKAKSQTDIVSEALTNVLMKNAQNCKAKSSSIQSLTISDIETPCPFEISGISQNMKISTNFSCAQKGSNKNDILNQFKSQLDSAVESKTSGIGGALYSSSESDSIAKISNKIKNNIDISNIAKCVSDNMKKQKMGLGRIKQTGKSCPTDQYGNPVKVTIKDITQSIVSDEVSKCVQDSENISSAVAELDNKLKSTTTSTLEGINPAILAGGSVSSSCVVGIVAILLVPMLLEAMPAE